MNARSSEVRGSCPGLWSPMASGDGLIVRLATGHRALTAAQVRGLADLAEAHGNGLLEVTRRANVQIRGVRESSLAALQKGVVALDLAGPRGTRELPLLVSPLFGLHPAYAGLERLSEAVAASLQAVVDALPAKFAVVLDAAGSLRAVRADLRLEVDGLRAPGWVRVSSDEGMYAAHASEDRSDAAATQDVLGVCRSEAAPRVVERVIEAWLARLHARRASALSRARERNDLRTAGAAHFGAHSWPAAPEFSAPSPFIGAQRADRRWFGVALPFGATAESFRALASAAERFGSGELRTTPLRGLLVLDVNDADLSQLSAAARTHGWVSDPGDPALRVAACAGAPACTSAWGETRALARRLGANLRDGESLHVSGCAKGCARSGAASITIVHAQEGSKLALGASAAEAAQRPAGPVSEIERQLLARSASAALAGRARELGPASALPGGPDPSALAGGPD